MFDAENMDVRVDPPHLIVDVPLAGAMEGASMELEYELDEVLQIDGDHEDVTVLDAHWHGLVVEDSDGETEHIDLRDVKELNGEDDG
jgi:hypothetical protein